MENSFALLKEEVKECGAVPVNQISHAWIERGGEAADGAGGAGNAGRLLGTAERHPRR